MPTLLPRPAVLLAVLLATLLAVTGCGGGSSTSKDEDPATALATAKKTLDQTTGVSIELRTDGLPDGVSSGIVKASGVGDHAPAFQGTLTVALGGNSVDVPVVGVGGKTYAKIPFTGGGFKEIDPADYGAPDPAKLLGTDAGFSALLPATTGLEKGKSVRGGKDNKEVLTTFTGTVPDTAVKNIIPSSSGDFDATYTLTDDDELREVELTGAFYGSGKDSSTYTIDFDDYGSHPSISAPS